ncbi:MAG TPA: DNA-directed RNA polymerase subunit alpha C-terminal domain-containing protein, partial [Pirellulaceae bacterium]
GLLERALRADPQHQGTLFQLAMENDRHGNDDVAMEYYERAAGQFPTHIGTLLNLGVLYEDHHDYPKAQKCYQRILEAHPTHNRARLFLVDAQAANDQFYDEEAQKRRDRMAQILAIPVSDFELSVRSRNCLQKMGINTLGDLARCTEQDLLSSKNFGETSLDEIREMLTSKGLQLGQFANEKPEPEPELDLTDLSADEQAMLSRPISDLNLSVRARKCMQRLGLNLIGELLRKTGDDLLECKNFGVTSLTEVREKLTSLGLRLRGEERVAACRICLAYRSRRTSPVPHSRSRSCIRTGPPAWGGIVLLGATSIHRRSCRWEPRGPLRAWRCHCSARRGAR